MLPSYLLYIGLLAACWLLSYCAQRYNQIAWVFAMIGLLTLVAGLRGETVGIDTANYLRLFTLICRGQLSLAYGLEESFQYLVYGLTRLVPSPRLLLGLFALITNGCILLRFWELRRTASFCCMVLCYYMAFYFTSFNAVRQFVAVGIIFFCSRYLDRKKPLRFILGVLGAMLIHLSGALGFGLLGVYCLRWKELPGGQRLGYLLGAMLTPVLLLLAAALYGRYAKYFTTFVWDVGLMLLLKLVFLLGTAIFVFAAHPGYCYFSGGHGLDRVQRYQMRTACLGYLAALFLAALGYLFDHMERVSLYYYLYESVYYGLLLKGKNPVNRLILGFCIALVTGYGFLYSMLHNSQGTMPYVLFWYS